jgi:hypothetical protein
MEKGKKKRKMMTTMMMLIMRKKRKKIYISVKFDGSGQRSWYGDSLRAGRLGDRIPADAKFPAPVQTSPGAPPASHVMVAGSF